MAHFCELDENNVVKRTIVIDNSELLDNEGNEQESIGIAYCEKHFGGRWIQTSYNASFRCRYAVPGMIYNEEIDMFHGPQPYPSWTFENDGTRCAWVPPDGKKEPDNGIDELGPYTWKWNEDQQEWVKNVRN